VRKILWRWRRWWTNSAVIFKGPGKPGRAGLGGVSVVGVLTCLPGSAPSHLLEFNELMVVVD